MRIAQFLDFIITLFQMLKLYSVECLAVTEELQKLLKRRTMQYFKISSKHFSQGTGENTDNSHRIAGVLDFIHRPDFNSYKKKEKQTRRFGNWICFRPQVREDTYSVGSLRKS
jgi:hypothetical protein